VASQADCMLHVDGSTAATWVGASTVGMVDIESDGVLAAGANVLRVDSSGANTAASYTAEILCRGTVAGSTDGTALRVIDSGAVAGTSSALYVDSTANNGMEIQTTAVAATNLILTGPASQTAPILNVDGSATTGWDGATGVGMVNLTGLGAHVHANASLLNITEGTGTTIADARGTCLRIVDTTVNGADSWVAYIDSTNNDGLLINTGAVADINLKLTGLAAQTGQMLFVDGTTGAGWDGADGIGMVHIEADGAHAHANASLLNIVDQTGTMIADARGSCLRIVDSTVNGADSWVGYIETTNNDGLLITTGAVADINLKLTGIQAQAAPLALIDGTTGTGWVGASTVGMVDIVGDGVLAAGANLLRVESGGANTAASYVAEITSTGNVTNSTGGIALRVTETGSAAGTSYAVYIASTSNEALHVDTGLSLFDERVTCTGGVTIGDAAVGTLILGTASELTVSNDGTTSKIVVATDPLTVGASATNYTQFSTAGLQTMAGTARPTQYMFFNPGDFNDCGTGTPVIFPVPTTLAASWALDGATSELIATSFRTPSNWASGTDLVCKIYYCANDANTKDVKWDVNSLFLTDATDNASTGSYTADTVTDTMAGAAYLLNVATVTIAAADVVADEICLLKIERDSTDAADTLDGVDVLFLGMEIAYTADTL